MAVACASKSASVNWCKLFPTELSTEVYSLVFVKKLFAVAVSYVLYIRRLFPDSAFFDKQLEGVKLKILREDTKFPGSSKVVFWLRGCFDAIDRKYLESAIISLFTREDYSSSEPYEGCKIVESYSFKITYAQSTVRLNISSNVGDSNSNICEIITKSDDEIRTATINLLKSIDLVGNKLKKLSLNTFMTMRLKYMDHAPETYVPPGFKRADNITFQFDGTPANVRIGNVQTSFHSINMHIQTNQLFLPKPKLSTSIVENSFSLSQQSLDAPTEKLSQSQSISKEHAEDDASTSQKQTLQSEEMEESQDTYDVRCPCGVHKDDGVMIVCDGCGMWQHAVCFRILEETDVPTCHICEHCSDANPSLLEKGGKTDASLQGLPEYERRSLCLLRRAVLLSTGLESLSPAVISKNLDVEYTVARSLFNRLVKEGVIKDSKGKRGEKPIQKDYLENVVLSKIFRSDESERKCLSVESVSDFISQKSSSLLATPSVRKTPRRSLSENDILIQSSSDQHVQSSEQEHLPLAAKRRRKSGIANTPVPIALR